MLTKSDLRQIQTLIQSETRVIVQQETRAIVSQELDPVKKDIRMIKSDLKKVKKTVYTMARVFDKQDVKLDKRVTRIENHLGLPQLA